MSPRGPIYSGTPAVPFRDSGKWGAEWRGNSCLSEPRRLPDRRCGTGMAAVDSVMVKAIEEALRARGREAACLALLLTSASCVPATAAGFDVAIADAPATSPAAAEAAVPPEPEPMVLKDVSPFDAAAINATIPIAEGPNVRAPSTVFRAASALDQVRSLDCLAQAIYYEARSEGEDGQRAVAQVVLNRVRHPAYPA